MYTFIVSILTELAAICSAVMLESHPHQAHKKQVSSHSHVMEEIMIGGGAAGFAGFALGTMGSSTDGDGDGVACYKNDVPDGTVAPGGVIAGAAATNVKGTMWTTGNIASEGCELPRATYNFQPLYVIAVGDEPALGDLAYRTTNGVGNCGQVYQIQCQSLNDSGKPTGAMNDAIYATVVSSCNAGAKDCGVDMHIDTWNAATNNAPPGVTNCNIQLTDKNPIKSGVDVCYIRPGSGPSEWYTSIGIYNTNGKRVSSIRIGDATGSPNGGTSVYYDIRPKDDKITSTSQVHVIFTDGSEVNFPYSICQETGGQTWCVN